MADLSRITLPSGTTYEFKDAVAREAIQGGTSWLGVTTTPLIDGTTETSIVVGGESVTVKNGDRVAYGNKEFVYSGAEEKWRELGDLSGLGSLALKNAVSGSFTPAGTVTAPTVNVTMDKTAVKSMATAGSVVAGTAGATVLPTLQMTVNNETLVMNWTDGSYTAPTPTQVTLPTFEEKTVAVDVESATASQPVFTGTAGIVNAD